MALHRRTLICQLVVLLVVTGDDVLVARARCIDQTAWKGLEQITSGTLEVSSAMGMLLERRNGPRRLRDTDDDDDDD